MDLQAPSWLRCPRPSDFAPTCPSGLLQPTSWAGLSAVLGGTQAHCRGRLVCGRKGGPGDPGALDLAEEPSIALFSLQDSIPVHCLLGDTSDTMSTGLAQRLGKFFSSAAGAPRWGPRCSVEWGGESA